MKCEGFSDQIRWMHGDESEEAEDGVRATRRHLYTGIVMRYHAI